MQGEIDLDNLFAQTDPRENLKEFSTYDASFVADKIDSTSPESARKWVRKASFMQLGYELDAYKDSPDLTKDQKKAIGDYMEFAFSDEFQQQAMTTRADIEKAIAVLDILGFDVTKQRKQLEETWS